MSQSPVQHEAVVEERDVSPSVDLGDHRKKACSTSVPNSHAFSAAIVRVADINNELASVQEQFAQIVLGRCNISQNPVQFLTGFQASPSR
jgi:hypothetical protein